MTRTAGVDYTEPVESADSITRPFAVMAAQRGDGGGILERNHATINVMRWGGEAAGGIHLNRRHERTAE